MNSTIDHYEELLRQLSVIRDRVRGVIFRETCGLYLFGRPGTSKTHTVRETLENLVVPHDYHQGHITPIGLFDLIATNRDRLIVLDDAISIFHQPIGLQILLAALSSSHDGARVRMVRYKTAREDLTVRFSGGLIVISNVALDGHHPEILAAIRDRVNMINYEPSDEQIEALIRRIADQGHRGIAPMNCLKVAVFLLEECRRREIRPSVRLFVNKALSDFALWESRRTETHWRDLVVSELEQQLVEIQHPQRDLRRAEQMEAERRIVLDLVMSCESREERIEQWRRITASRFGQAKSQAAFYRRLVEVKEAGKLPVVNGHPQT
jgi:hypothetical protein